MPTTATAVHANVVVGDPTNFGHLTVFPFGWSPPLANTFSPNQNVANGILMRSVTRRRKVCACPTWSFKPAPEPPTS